MPETDAYLTNRRARNSAQQDEVQPPRGVPAGYVLELGDGGRLLEVNAASAATLTVPADASAPFPVGVRVDVVQAGAGQVTLVAADGVTLRTAGTLVLVGQWSAVSLYKRADDEWVVVGDVEAA